MHRCNGSNNNRNWNETGYENNCMNPFTQHHYFMNKQKSQTFGVFCMGTENHFEHKSDRHQSIVENRRHALKCSNPSVSGVDCDKKIQI